MLGERSLKIPSRNKKGGVHVLSEWKKTMLLGPRLGTYFLISCYFVPSFILSRSRSEMLSIECWNVWKLVIFQFMTDFLCSISKLVCPPFLSPPPQQPPQLLGRYLSIYLRSLSKGAHVQTNANFLNGKCASCGMGNNNG